MSNIRSTIEKQARAAIVQYAFFRWENAVIIGVTLLLIFFLPRPFPGWPGWGWPVLGVLSVTLMVFSSLTDAKARTNVWQALFESQYNPHRVQNAQLRAIVEKALSQQRSLEEYIGRQRAGLLRATLEAIAAQTADWAALIDQLALRLDAYQRDPALVEERESIARELDVLVTREQATSDPAIKQQLADVIASKRKRRDSLIAADARMARVERELAQSLVVLVAACSQAQSIGTLNVQSGDADRLKQDIQAQTAQLRELLDQVNAIYVYEDSPD